MAMESERKEPVDDTANNGNAGAETVTGDLSKGGGDDAVTATVDDSEIAEEFAELPLLKNLLILPPLQKKGTLQRDEILDAVPLPPIRAEEPVSSLRAALGEVCGFAHFTNYRFELEPAPEKSTKSKQDPYVASPYTGTNAVVSVPWAVKSLETDSQEATTKEKSLVLDDYGNLSLLLEQGLQDGSAFRIVLERYDTASVRDHVTRLRALLDGNAPIATSLDDNSEAKATDSSAKQNSSDATNNDSTTNHADTSKKNDTSKDSESPEDPSTPPKDLPMYANEQKATIDGKNLRDFFYLACGVERDWYMDDSGSSSRGKTESTKSKKKNKKSKDNKNKNGGDNDMEDPTSVEIIRDLIPRINELEEKTRVKCTIRFSGFHPPPMPRRLMGDLAYLECKPPDEEKTIHITATSSGFYVNRSTSDNGEFKFNPSPAADPCFSHELLDTLLQASTSFSTAWGRAIEASKERASLTSTLNKDGPFSSLFHVAIRGDFKGYSSPTTASAAEGIDPLIQCPSWIVPVSKAESEMRDSWNRFGSHKYNPARAEDEISNTFGVDVRSGAVRDWNEELQSAREMPVSNLTERIERARVLNKVLSDFGEASVLGVKAICDGHISPMNPNEATRSQVYLHNNIFFSRAVDAGAETFKIAKGDNAAKKSASRDLHCIGTLHRMERVGLYTLATVLVDYLGTRFVCQSILPGILNGEKTHTILYGAVEAGSPLMWDKEMHELLENTFGKALMIASRPLPRTPLTDKRTAEIEAARSLSPLYVAKTEEEKKEPKDLGPTIEACAPLEAKGIRGSDQRKYVLDITRLTPRDANWVPKSNGGSGRWESVPATESNVPPSLEDDEWTLAVLRPELITAFTQSKMGIYLQKKKIAEDSEKKDKSKDNEGKTPATDTNKTEGDDGLSSKMGENEGKGKTPSQDTSSGVKETQTNGSDDKEEKDEKEDSKPPKPSLSTEDMDYLRSLRMNVNVFLPDVRSLEGIDDAAVEQLKKDEEMVREAATFLWDECLPRITREIREGSGHQIPQDGKRLTEYLHQYGINCRYLGRLAQLAKEEETQDQQLLEDIKQGRTTRPVRRIMPLSWLDLLECEMVARAAKHILDKYLTENGGVAAIQPAQTIASFLCAVVSNGEETAAQTEIRMSKASNTTGPDEDDLNSLTITHGGENSFPAVRIRSWSEVWADIEQEVGRRFRYSLTMYGTEAKDNRAIYMSLLRRVCQRTGVRLVGKNYQVGGKCLCGGSDNFKITASFPITALDIIDFVPLIKHAAAHGEAFAPCSSSAPVGMPALHISLQDARSALEAAHLHHNARALPRALDLAQEACALYQKVTESPAHPGVVTCIDLMGTILFDAGEPALGAANASKALGLSVQIGGFDSSDTLGGHMILSQMLLSAGKLTQSVKHLRAAIYLMELMGGPRNVELSNAYHKLGSIYHGVNDLESAHKFYQEAANRENCDRLMEGMVAKSASMVLASLGEYKQAIDNEKRAFHVFSSLLGDEHSLTKSSDHALKKFMKMAVEFGNRMVEDEKKRKEEEAAEAMASQIEADLAAEEERQKKKNNKKKKGKK